MIIYTLVMTIIAALFVIVGYLVYNGHTDMIHDYHQERVSDKANYGRAIGRGVVGIGLSALLSGIVSVFGESNAIVALSVAVYVIGFILSFSLIWKAQKKYNGGMF